MNTATDHLDAASDALRASCHIRPDRDNAATIYSAFGSITSIIATLAHIVDVAADTASRATGSDDGRTVDEARLEIRSLTERAISTLDDANRAISRAHEVVAHLIFAVDDEDAYAELEP